MELKLHSDAYGGTPDNGSNCTFMELKLNNAYEILKDYPEF